LDLARPKCVIFKYKSNALAWQTLPQSTFWLASFGAIAFVSGRKTLADVHALVKKRPLLHFLSFSNFALIR
jgi:hypothetical protein